MEWKNSWSYLPINYGCSLGKVGNITQRTFFRNNLSGEKVRLKFSNLYGVSALKIEKVMLAQKKNKDITEVINIQKNGQSQIVIEPGEEFYSDEVAWSIEAGTDIVLSIYLKEEHEIQSACSSHSGKSWISYFSTGECEICNTLSEEKSALDTFSEFCKYPDPNTLVIGVSGIQIYTNKKVKTMVLFGDSIIHHSHFADALIEELYAKYQGKITVVNRGISGNRILHGSICAAHIPGNGSIYGKSVLERFEKECFEDGNPDYILFLEGTNDMIFPEWFERLEENITSGELADAIVKIIESTHKRKCRFWIGTILPYQPPQDPVCPKGEVIRKELNEWIRKQKVSDGILDFADMLTDKNFESTLQEEVHIGDWIHPNDKGGKMMVSALMESEMLNF